ncbi:hypothetical protein PF003_g18266 [Phytophthora fragariae]|nr:hypothetical protein PF003_g18266 [Phytophthora fragariae]
MAYAMDFRAIWPLLRKEGWSWKPATGIQIHHNYIKPGCKLKGGAQGVDFFNGEDELLAYIRSDTELCERLSISNVAVRPPNEAIQSTLPGQALAPPKRPSTPTPVPEASPLAKRAKSASKRPAKTPRAPKAKPKQPSKKQMAQEADKRRKELAAFDKVWGERQRYGRWKRSRAACPSSSLKFSSRADKGCLYMLDYADRNGGDHSNADMNSTTAQANADTDANADGESPANADTEVPSNADTGKANATSEDEKNANGPVPIADNNRPNPVADSTSASANREVCDLSDASPRHRHSISEEEAYEPSDEEDGSVEVDEVCGVRNDQEREDEIKEGEEPPRNVEYRALRDAACGTPLRFDFVDPLDPNIVGDTNATALETDGEGGADSAEGIDDGVADSDSDEDDDDLPREDNLHKELSRVTDLLDAAELERLHMRVQGGLYFKFC